MVRTFPLLLPASVLLCGAVGAPAQDKAPARPTAFPEKVVTLNISAVADGLASLSKQAGVKVVDRRADPVPVKAVWQAEGPFWSLLDDLAAKAGARVSVYQPDGALALVDGLPNKAPASYHGPFRFVLKRVSSQIDLESGLRSSTATIDLVWGPFAEPLYVQLLSQEIARPGFQPAAPGPALAVFGKRGTEIEVTFHPPLQGGRSLPRLAGKLRVIGPVNLLSGTFDNLGGAMPRIIKDASGASANLTRFTRAEPTRWEADMTFQQPPGGPGFESFQTWLGNNHVELVHKDGKTSITPRPLDREILELTDARAVVKYHFVEGKKGPKLGDLADWQLVVRAPGTIIQADVPFELKDVPLP